MTDNTTNNGGADATSGSALIAVDSDEHDDFAEDFEIDDLPEELTEIDDGDSGRHGVLSAGAVSGGFGFAGLALAVVSLTTSWTSGVVVSHGQVGEEVNAPSVHKYARTFAGDWYRPDRPPLRWLWLSQSSVGCHSRSADLA